MERLKVSEKDCRFKYLKRSCFVCKYSVFISAVKITKCSHCDLSKNILQKFIKFN